MGLQQQGQQAGALAEWKAHWALPIAAALGYTTSVIHIYGIGAYIAPVGESFGWSRTEVTAGLTLSTLFQAVISIPVGLMVDRIGPRRLGVTGIVLLCAAFALLSTATGSFLNWMVLWSVIALCSMPVQATIWTSAVASRFTASRGLALAVTLCGASIATALFPVMGAWLIGKVGWRSAFAWQAGLWIAVAFPVIFLFFRGAHDSAGKSDAGEAAAPRDLSGATMAEGMRSGVYRRLLLACLLFTFTIISTVVHFVSILTDRGADPVAAAGVASLIGLFSIFGRLATGMLLDRFEASKVGAVVFLLPVLACLLLAGSGGYGVQAFAAALIGLTLGAEIDVVAYLVTRHFGLRSFGALYGGLLAALSIGTALGPIGAAQVFDRTGSYLPFLWTAAGLLVVASLALLSLPKPDPARYARTSS